MYFIEYKIKEEDEDNEEKIKLFMQEAERRISNVLFHSTFWRIKMKVKNYINLIYIFFVKVFSCF